MILLYFQKTIYFLNTSFFLQYNSLKVEALSTNKPLKKTNKYKPTKLNKA